MDMILLTVVIGFVCFFMVAVVLSFIVMRRTSSAALSEDFFKSNLFLNLQEDAGEDGNFFMLLGPKNPPQDLEDPDLFAEYEGTPNFPLMFEFMGHIMCLSKKSSSEKGYYFSKDPNCPLKHFQLISRGEESFLITFFIGGMVFNTNDFGWESEDILAKLDDYIQGIVDISSTEDLQNLKIAQDSYALLNKKSN